MIQHHIISRNQQEKKQKVIQVANEIMEKGMFNRGAYWEFMKKVKSRNRMIKGRAINDEDGNRLDEPEKIRNRYAEYYKELLTTRKAVTEDERKIEEMVDRCIEAMKKKAEEIPIQPITNKEYEEMKKSLKTKKAPDLQGWFYEMIIHAGQDLEESIKSMMNMILKMKEIPDEWNEMEILPIDKTTGWLELKNKRGLFLTNIMSKCVETVLFQRREEILRVNLSPFQNGGIAKRRREDNLFMVNHTINEYRKRKKDLYLLFADIEKCFDILWLKDCIIELTRNGTPIEEAMFIYEINKNIKATVRTPVGKTEKIELKEIVRQGTVGGNKLCVVSTDRINRMGSYLERDGLRYPLFVDDKLGLGDADTLKEMCWKMNTLETTKKYKYNTKTGKSEWMVIKNSRKKEEELELKVASGKIGRTKKYKYVGDMYDEKGKNMSKIKFKEEKISLMINRVKSESSERKIGKAALTVRLMLIEVVITPTILSSTETWHNITKQEHQQIRKMHHQILTRTLILPNSTPYMGIISELNIIPFTDCIWYRKFMWYHQLLNSDNERHAKKVLEVQMMGKDNWYTELQQYANTNDININREIVTTVTYDEYKQYIKQKIRVKVDKELTDAQKAKTKLRWIKPGRIQNYLKKCSIGEATRIMKMRFCIWDE